MRLFDLITLLLATTASILTFCTVALTLTIGLLIQAARRRRHRRQLARPITLHAYPSSKNGYLTTCCNRHVSQLLIGDTDRLAIHPEQVTCPGAHK